MVIVKLFANLREMVGKSEIYLDAKTIDELLKKLIEMCPEIEPLIRSEYVAIFVNGRRVSGNRILNDDDVVALLPPFSGG